MFSWEQLNQTVANVPPGANPYEFVRRALPGMDMVGDAAPVTFSANMIVNIILFGIILFACCVTLIIKAKQNSLWFVKSRETSEGGMSLWLPNTTVLFTTFYLIFSSLAIVYITTLVCAQKHTARSSTPQFLMIVLWPPMFYAFLTQIWGMAGALAMTQPVFGFKLKPWLINAITLVCIVAVPPALMPNFALAAMSTHSIENTYTTLFAHLRDLAESWDDRSAFVVDDVLQRAGDRLIHNQDRFPHFLGNGFAIFMIITCTAFVLFTPFAISYLRLLGHQLQSSAPRSFNSDTSARSDRYESLAMSYHLMVVEVVLTLAAVFTYAFLSGWAGFFTISFLSNGRNAVTQHILFYYCASLLGAPVCCLVAFRTYKTFKEDREISRCSSQKSSGRKPVLISTEVHVDIDSEAKRDFFHHSTTSSGPSINVELAHIPKKEEQV